MKTTRRWVRRATARDMHFFLNPNLWRCYPFLPVTRQAIDDPDKQLGVLFDARGLAGIYGYSSTVFLTNLFSMPRTTPRFLALPKYVYDSFDELASDGWIVD